VLGGIEAIIYSEQQRAEWVLDAPTLAPNRMTLKRTAEAGLIIDPMQMKSLHRWLGEKIKAYESVFACIPSPEEIESRSRRGTGQ
jgi:hypothetical protein